MSERKQAAHESPTATKKAALSEPTGPATASGAQADILGLQRQAGNRAVSELVRSSGPGQPLPAATQATMEARLGHDFGDVRVHTDDHAAQAAHSVDAAAFTSGSEIVFDTGNYAPGTPAGDDLLAHELTHVMQQRHADAVTDGVSAPGEAAEQNADAAAHGGGVPIKMGGTVPAVQRQPAIGKEKQNVATRLEVQAALTDYLQRVMQEQGGQTLHVTPQIKQTIQLLFQRNLDGMMRIQAWLNGVALPGSPAEFAREVARRLPATIPSDRLTRLGRAPAKENQDTRPKSFGEAAGGTVVDSTVAPIVKKLPISKSLQDTIIDGARSAVAEGLVAIVDAAMGGGQIDDQTKNAIHGAVEAAIKQQSGKGMDRQQEGAGSPYRQEQPPSATPAFPSVPGEKIIKAPAIKFDFPATPAAPKPAAPLLAANPAVEAAIGAVNNNALIPEEVRGTPRAGEYANASDFARDIARRLEAAQKRKDYGIIVELGENYRQAKDRRAIYDAVRDIGYRIRDALPHHASAVMQVSITIGGKVAYSFPLHPSSQ